MEEIVSSTWTQWGFLGVAVGLGLWILRDKNATISGLKDELAAVRATFAAERAELNRRNYELSDRLATSANQSIAQGTQFQSAISTLQLLVEKVLARL